MLGVTTMDAVVDKYLMVSEFSRRIAPTREKIRGQVVAMMQELGYSLDELSVSADNLLETMKKQNPEIIGFYDW